MLWKEQYQLLLNALLKGYDGSEASAIAKLAVEHTGNNSFRSLEGEPVSSKQTEQINNYLQQLLSYRPVQYVLNEAWFYNLSFEVNESVLIPRPETEELVDLIIKEVQGNPFTFHHSQFTILDIGTGSGCIPISIKKNIAEAEVSAVDVCSEALHVAMKNALTYETEINFHLLDFLDESKWKELGMFNIIISNPPYIKSSERKTMSEHVLQYEPHKALFVPDDDALLFYKKIADFALKHLAPNGKVYVEINQQLGKETANVFLEKGFKEVLLLKDMSGNERFLKVSS